MMSNHRNLLHVSKLDAFLAWLDSNHIPHRPGKGAYQVRQILTDTAGWQVVFRKLDMPEHYSVNKALVPLVRQFIHDSTVGA